MRRKYKHIKINTHISALLRALPLRLLKVREKAFRPKRDLNLVMDAYYETDLNENGIMCLNVSDRLTD